MKKTPRLYTWAISSMLVMGVAGSVTSAQEPPKKGLGVGEMVPISSMRCVVGRPKDRNTCLAGKYRTHRTISLYVHSIEDQHLNMLVKQVERLLAKHNELRGYVLVLKGNQFDNSLKEKLRGWAKQQGVAKLDIAIANSNPAKTFGIGKDTGVVVVYSDKRRVLFHRGFAQGKFDEAAVKELTGKLAELAR